MYEANIVQSPFWGAKRTVKGGRDPLAVQNSSVVIYSNMIKGITNVTGRVRYNGFFCWLLTLIAKKLFEVDREKVDDAKEQIKYIRRAELLLAYAMLYKYPTATGVSGMQYAQKHKEGDIIDLAKGADWIKLSTGEKRDVYWQNREGVFGQYYKGVLSQLELIFVPDSKHNTYRPTEEGLRLYTAFRKKLENGVEDLFWNAISLGKIDKERLGDFSNMALHIVEGEEELDEYRRIMCKADGKDVISKKDYFHRLDSIKLILCFINGEGSTVPKKKMVLEFLKYNFELCLKKGLDVSEEQLFWFLYELNELSHAAYEAFHFAILYSASSEPKPLDSVLDKLKVQYDEFVLEDENSLSIYELYDQIQKLYKVANYGGLVHVACSMILNLFTTIEKHLETLWSFGRNANFDVVRNGFALTLLIRLRQEYNVNSWDFAEDCLYMAINDHLRSSYSKSSIEQGLVHNYLVEDGLIWQLRVPEPVRTSPRLQNVLQYIEDIKWIESVGANKEYLKVMDSGLKLIGNDRA